MENKIVKSENNTFTRRNKNNKINYMILKEKVL